MFVARRDQSRAVCERVQCLVWQWPQQTDGHRVCVVVPPPLVLSPSPCPDHEYGQRAHSCCHRDRNFWWYLRSLCVYRRASQPARSSGDHDHGRLGDADPPPQLSFPVNRERRSGCCPSFQRSQLRHVLVQGGGFFGGPERRQPYTRLWGSLWRRRSGGPWAAPWRP